MVKLRLIIYFSFNYLSPGTFESLISCCECLSLNVCKIVYNINDIAACRARPPRSQAASGAAIVAPATLRKFKFSVNCKMWSTNCEAFSLPLPKSQDLFERFGARVALQYQPELCAPATPHDPLDLPSHKKRSFIETQTLSGSVCVFLFISV